MTNIFGFHGHEIQSTLQCVACEAEPLSHNKLDDKEYYVLSIPTPLFSSSGSIMFWFHLDVNRNRLLVSIRVHPVHLSCVCVMSCSSGLKEEEKMFCLLIVLELRSKNVFFSSTSDILDKYKRTNHKTAKLWTTLYTHHPIYT